MDGVRLVPPGGGEVVGDSADRRVEILSDDETLNATWSRFGPRREGADLHVHREHTDLFYVLAGELEVRLGLDDRTVAVPAGTLARVPPLVVHGFRNGTDAEVRYLNLHAPGKRFADYLRAVRDGRRFSYDQHDPPETEARPATDAAVGAREELEARPGLLATLLADVDEIRVVELEAEPGAAIEAGGGELVSYYVLDGELTLAVGRELGAGAGSWVQLPRGASGTFAVAGGRPARLLELRTPAGSR